MQEQLRLIINKLKELLSQMNEKYDSKLPYIITTLITAIIVVGGTKVFIDLTEVLQSEYLINWDKTTSDFIQSYRLPLLTKYFVFVTHLGDIYGYLSLFIICFIIFYIAFKKWKYLIQLFLAMAFATASNLTLKQMINRARPDGEYLVTVKTLSYPSGHAMISMVFYGLLIYLISHFPIKRIWKFVFIFLSILLIVSIGISRVYLGVHYPSDIVGGYIAGFIWVVFCVMIFNLMKIFKKDPET